MDVGLCIAFRKRRLLLLFYRWIFHTIKHHKCHSEVAVGVCLLHSIWNIQVVSFFDMFIIEFTTRWKILHSKRCDPILESMKNTEAMTERYAESKSKSSGLCSSTFIVIVNGRAQFLSLSFVFHSLSPSHKQCFSFPFSRFTQAVHTFSVLRKDAQEFERRKK